MPAIWPREVRNALLAAHRARRLSAREFDERLGIAGELPIDVDAGQRPESLMRSVENARRHGLSLYEATCLELAERTSLPLATFDAKLLKAGKTLRIPAAF